MVLCLLADSVEVASCMSRVEIDICLWRGGVLPYLAEDAEINCTHWLLADDVETVSWREGVVVVSFVG